MAVEVTSTIPERLIYFRGHKKEENSALVTRVCRDYETVTGLLRGESATRTLLNLCNLHAVRGVVAPNGNDGSSRLIVDTSMSGPHVYMGFIEPEAAYILAPSAAHSSSIPGCGPQLAFHCVSSDRNEVHGMSQAAAEAESRRPPVPGEFLTALGRTQWIRGRTITAEQRRFYFPASAVRGQDEPILVYQELVDTDSGAADSLFDNPGVLALPVPHIAVKILENPQDYDLSSFRCQVVPNNKPFMFRQDLVRAHEHARSHKLRVVTYHYGERYVPDYVMHGSGLFLEQHEFVQAISPATTSSCGGFVLTARPRAANCDELELLALRIPLGCTWLVDVGCIHGDSNLTGTFVMAMTGNHRAMQSADTVFLKHKESGRNVAIVPTTGQAAPIAPDDTKGDVTLLMTSNRMAVGQLRAADELVKAGIRQRQSAVKQLWWQPVIATPGTKLLSSWKTLGTLLPVDSTGEQPEGQ
jgi:hypothetical protein